MEESLLEKLYAETSARIKGCKSQMEPLNILFGLCLGQKLYGLSDNLSKILHKTKMSAISGQRLGSFTTETLEKIRNDYDFDLFYELTSKKVSAIIPMPSFSTPWKHQTKQTKLFLVAVIWSSQRSISNSANAYQPSSAHQLFKEFYFEAIDSIVSTTKDRFGQPSFHLFSDVEQLLLKSINEEDYQQELINLLKIFVDDINPSALPSELSIISTVCKDGNPAHFDDVLSILKALSTNEKRFIKNVITTVKTMLVNGDTTVTTEGSFSMDRGIKTWLRSTMTQRRFNALASLNSNKSLVD